MAPGELDLLPAKAADLRVEYGTERSQYGDLRVSSGPGPHPVAILIHGGCFKAAYATLRYMAAMADALKGMGIATWDIEYRRLGEPGGGWPGTYGDVGRAVDHLRALATEHSLDLKRVVVVGHSAGGHLAMWAAARGRTGRRSGATHRDAERGTLRDCQPARCDVAARRVDYPFLAGRETAVTVAMHCRPAAAGNEHVDVRSLTARTPTPAAGGIASRCCRGYLLSSPATEPASFARRQCLPALDPESQTRT